MRNPKTTQKGGGGCSQVSHSLYNLHGIRATGDGGGGAGDNRGGDDGAPAVADLRSKREVVWLLGSPAGVRGAAVLL